MTALIKTECDRYVVAEHIESFYHWGDANNLHVKMRSGDTFVVISNSTPELENHFFGAIGFEVIGIETSVDYADVPYS